jgi:hypothetical protein
MDNLSASELLDVWERGFARPLPGRILKLLAAAFPDESIDELAELSIGCRDARLLRLRERLFGPELTAVAQCPACGEQVESTFRVDDVRLEDEDAAQPLHSVGVEGYRATFRLPTSSDLLALTDPRTARETLLTRCLNEVFGPDGEAVSVGALPAEVTSAIAGQMAAADPQADIELRVSCPSCDHRWAAAFDIASFLWKELHAWALRTLRDVSRLARSYGWRETDVLSLSATRRQIYLELSRQ